MFNLLTSESEWSIEATGDNVADWLSATPLNGTLDGNGEGPGTTQDIKLNLVASPEHGVGTKRTELILRNNGVGRQVQSVFVEMIVKAGPASVGNSKASFETSAADGRLYLPFETLVVHTKDSFGNDADASTHETGKFRLEWKLAPEFACGAANASACSGEQDIVHAPSKDAGFRLALDVSPNAKGNYTFTVTNGGVHVAGSPFNATFLPQLCLDETQIANPLTGKGCVCAKGHESVGAQCNPCKQGEVWWDYSFPCEPCPAGTRWIDQEGGVCEKCERGRVSNAGKTDCEKCDDKKKEVNGLWCESW